MSEIKFLPQQEKILSVKGKNLIVSASAGSGKTTVMIEKIVRLVKEDNIPLSSLLVLTYTKSASDDMKAKLEKSLKKENVDDEILDQLDDCDISTIHSFCQKQIKRYFANLDIDSSFEIVSNTKQLEIKEQAISLCLEKFKKERSAEFFSLLKNLKNGRTEKNIKKLIYSIENYISVVVDKDKFRRENAFFCYDNLTHDFSVLNEHIVTTLNSFKLRLECFMEQADQVDLKEYITVCNQTISQILMVSGDFDLFKNLEIINQIKLPVLRKIDYYYYEQLNIIKKSLSDFLSECKRFDFSNLDHFKKSFSYFKQTLEFVLEMEKCYEEIFQDIKKQNNVLDFSDLEKNMIKLLENADVQNELRQKYKYVFVDEFQDTNQTQELLISLLSGKDNRFIVGDVKQSIYGFRRSNPKIFLEKEKEYKKRKDSKSLTLNVNFRSDKQILEFANHVFSKIMSEQSCEINYKEDGMFEPFVENKNLGIEKVELHIINKKDKKQKNLPKPIYSVEEDVDFYTDESDIDFEAIKVAEKILSLYEKEVEIDGKKRKLTFSDMTILVRKRGSKFERFCSKLTQLNVPIYASNNQNLTDEVEVKRIICLLKLSQNLFDEISLASVMLSGFGGFDEGELAKIKTFSSEESFSQNVLSVSNENSPLGEKTKKFLNTIESFKKDLSIFGCTQALKNIIRKTQYKIKLMPLANGENKIACINRFLEIAGSEDFDFNVSNLLEYLQLDQANIKAPDFFAGDSDCVSITTMHSSKGLEYPVVFLVDLADNFSSNKTDGQIEINEDAGISLKLNLPSEHEMPMNFANKIIKLENEKQEFAEKIRLLYVAMTRPKYALYMYGTMPTNQIMKIKQSIDVLSMKSYLSLIAGCLSENEISKLKSGQNVENDLVKVFVETAMEQETLPKDYVVFSKGDESLTQKIIQNINEQKQELPIALKNSVSSINAQNNYESNNTYVRKLTIDEHDVKTDISQIGTQYHKVFELLDFNKIHCEEDVKNALSNFDFSNLNLEKIVGCCKLLSGLFKNEKVFKESKFMMNVPYNKVCDGNDQTPVLIQGIIDCHSQNGILVDYKYTTIKNENYILEKYKKQIELYKMALNLGKGFENVKSYILLIDSVKLVEVWKAFKKLSFQKSKMFFLTGFNDWKIYNFTKKVRGFSLTFVF